MEEKLRNVENCSHLRTLNEFALCLSDGVSDHITEKRKYRERIVGQLRIARVPRLRSGHCGDGGKRPVAGSCALRPVGCMRLEARSVCEQLLHVAMHVHAPLRLSLFSICVVFLRSKLGGIEEPHQIDIPRLKLFDELQITFRGILLNLLTCPRETTICTIQCRNSYL